MGSEPPQGSASGFRGVFASKGFRRLLIGQAVSSLGDWVATFAFIVGAYALSHQNQTAVAVVLVLRLVPPMFAAPVGGVVADRLPRRTIMVTCDLSRAALIALVPFVGLTLLYVIAFVHESISLFFLPARDASVPCGRRGPHGPERAENDLRSGIAGRDCDPEVGDSDSSILIDEHVGGFQVAMQNALGVSRSEPATQLVGDFEHAFRRQTAGALEKGREILSLHEFH